jgi:uncharacterized membrane protein
MSNAAVSARTAPLTKRSVGTMAKILVSTGIVTISIAFVLKYVFRYYLNYNEAAFTDPIRGAANYWAMRAWLLMHMSGGVVALLTGPFQFWTGFRTRYFRLHRWTGRLFLLGVTVGSLGAFRMSVASTFGWAFGFSLFVLAAVWATTAGMAYYAIRQRRIQSHQEWMVRAYIITFAFVTFRVLSDYGPTALLKPDIDRVLTIAWSCWSVPLFFGEVLLQIRRMRLSKA